jgi:putative heme-binding domain-containing protein
VSIYIPKNQRHADFVMQVQSSRDLVCLERSEPVYRALLTRHGLHPQYRDEALEGLARLHGSDPLSEWLAAVRRIDEQGIVLDPIQADHEPTPTEILSVLASYARRLPGFTESDLGRRRDSFRELAASSNRAEVRRLGFAALVAADGSPRGAWQLAGQNPTQLILALPWIGAPAARVELYQVLRPLLTDQNPLQLRQATLEVLPSVPGHDQEIFLHLAAAIDDERLRDVAVAALLAGNNEIWPADNLAPLAEQLLQILAGMPADERTEASGEQITKLAGRLADRMPSAAGDVVRARLAGLEVARHKITAIREQMAFDREVLVVGAGQPVELLFNNQDVMPHNLVVTIPDGMELVGTTADRMATDPAAAGREYVPDIPEVLHHTRMLGPGETAKLFFVAPAEPGVYPILCTFPGHWLKMYAALVVTSNVEDFLAANRPLPPRDKLLGIVTYDHDYDQLAGKLDQKTQERSFVRGQTAFQSRACISCHAVKGKGGRVGPELSDLAKENKSQDILRSILFPSEKIDPKFAKVELEELKSGRLHTGVLVPQDDENIIYLVDDPLADCEPLVFDRQDVEIVPLKISPMPIDLLRRSSPQEVLDLVTYLMAAGDPAHRLYRASEKNR